MDVIRKKELMDDYVGIKFRTVQIQQDPPTGFEQLYRLFRDCTDALRDRDMTPRNAGNMSMTYANGIAITSSGSNLGMLEEDEIVFVLSCLLEEQMVQHIGPHVPSSETFLHYLIYRSRPDAGAIVHAHDEATSALLVGEVKETEKEEPYGTVELARIACETFSRDERIIVLKNHGYVAIGSSLREATDLIVATHLKLVHRG